MPRYSEERKASVLKKLLPPLNQSVPDVAAQEGISEATLYNWRIAVREQGLPVPGSGKSSDNWSPQAKFAVVVETASMSEAELSEYCREKGLYPEQIAQWREACIAGTQMDAERRKAEARQAKQDRREIKKLKSELNRKDKALAETAALLALRKKLNTLWEDDGDD